MRVRCTLTSNFKRFSVIVYRSTTQTNELQLVSLITHHDTKQIKLINLIWFIRK